MPITPRATLRIVAPSRLDEANALAGRDPMGEALQAVAQLRTGLEKKAAEDHRGDETQEIATDTGDLAEDDGSGLDQGRLHLKEGSPQIAGCPAPGGKDPLADQRALLHAVRRHRQGQAATL